jgi:hypothetical protein
MILDDKEYGWIFVSGIIGLLHNGDRKQIFPVNREVFWGGTLGLLLMLLIKTRTPN